MVTFCSITAFASTVIRGKEQGFHVRAVSGKADSISVPPVLEKPRRGLSSIREDLSLTNRRSPGLLAPQPHQRGPAAASGSASCAGPAQQRRCQRASPSQTPAAVTVSVALLSSSASICLIFSSRKQHWVLTAAYASHYQVIFFFSPGKSRYYHHWCNWKII